MGILQVTQVSGDTVLSQEAYILFYARQGTPWFSSIMESPTPISCFDPTAMNTSPKSVLDVDGLNKSDPILNANVERSEAGESKEFDYSCQEEAGFLEMDDICEASNALGQFAAGSNHESVNSNGSKYIAQVPPEDNAILNAIVMGNSSIENGALDKTKCSPEAVVDFKENDCFHPLTPPSSPSDSPGN